MLCHTEEDFPSWVNQPFLVCMCWFEKKIGDNSCCFVAYTNHQSDLSDIQPHSDVTLPLVEERIGEPMYYIHGSHLPSM